MTWQAWSGDALLHYLLTHPLSPYQHLVQPPRSVQRLAQLGPRCSYYLIHTAADADVTTAN